MPAFDARAITNAGLDPRLAAFLLVAKLETTAVKPCLRTRPIKRAVVATLLPASGATAALAGRPPVCCSSTKHPDRAKLGFRFVL